MTTRRPIGRTEAFVVSYITIVVAATAALDAMALAYGIAGANGLREIALLMPATVFATIWFGIGASLAAIPAVVVGHPLAIAVAHRLRSARMTAAVGALAGPLLGGTILLLMNHGEDSSLNGTFEQALFLGVPAIAAGTAVGWMAARTIASRDPGGRP